MKTQQAQCLSSSARPTDFLDIPYSPALLLDARLHASITDDPDFRSFCQWGFDGYFESLVKPNTEQWEYEDRFYTVDEVRKEVFDGVVVAHKEQETSLVACIALSLGWLSALALSQYREAQEGLSELVRLLDREQRSQQWPSHTSRSVDSAGWPLDL